MPLLQKHSSIYVLVIPLVVLPSFNHSSSSLIQYNSLVLLTLGMDFCRMWETRLHVTYVDNNSRNFNIESIRTYIEMFLNSFEHSRDIASENISVRTRKDVLTKQEHEKQKQSCLRTALSRDLLV
jgi:hypothetical protein